MNGKRGITPVIATVLLIAIVVVLAAIIFLWASSFLEERVRKFDGPIEYACNDVSFEASIQTAGDGSLELQINNRADVPLYGVVIKALDAGEVRPLPQSFGTTVKAGESEKMAIEAPLQSGQRALIVPVLLGAQGDSREQFTCPDEKGKEVTVI